MKRASKQIIPLDTLFQAVRGRKIGSGYCFLCGKRLTARTRADEHVFPSWIQKRFKLSSQRLQLLNGTSIQYSKLTIPCCRHCNTICLCPLERRLQRAYSKGIKGMLSLDRKILWIWLSKILYGIIYREHLLSFDRKNTTTGRLVRRSFLKRFEMFHLFMQAARVPMDFQPRIPASIFLFETQTTNNHLTDYFFNDNPLLMTIALRMGAVGIIAALHDGGAQEACFEDYMKRFLSLALHPLQFDELATKVLYKTSLQVRFPTFITLEGDGRYMVAQMPLQGFSREPIWGEWSQERYANILAMRVGARLDEIYKPPNEVMTWLEDTQGTIQFLDVKKFLHFGPDQDMAQRVEKSYRRLRRRAPSFPLPLYRK